jgi:hypothetical protein
MCAHGSATNAFFLDSFLVPCFALLSLPLMNNNNNNAPCAYVLFSVQKPSIHAARGHHFAQHREARQTAETVRLVSTISRTKCFLSSLFLLDVVEYCISLNKKGSHICDTNCILFFLLCDASECIYAAAC